MYRSSLQVSLPGKLPIVPSYIATHRAAASEQVPALVALAESLLGRSIAGGVTIRNVAVVPRADGLHLHIQADAPMALRVARLFSDCGLAPVSLMLAGDAAWARLVGAPASAGSPLHPNRAGLIAV